MLEILDSCQGALLEVELNLDAHDELSLCRQLADGLQRRGHQVALEVPYNKRGRVHRCDLVVDGSWIEVKRAARVGIGGEDPHYLYRFYEGALDDLIKLTTTPAPDKALFLGVLFDTEEVGQLVCHQLGRLSLDQGLPVGLPRRRAFPILDWRGNPACTLIALEVNPR